MRPRALIALLVLTALPGLPASAAAPRPVTWTGTGCSEAIVVGPVPLSSLRAALPARYVPATDPADPSKGYVSVAVAKCESLRVDGVAQPDPVVSDVGVPLASAPGLGRATYHLWQVTGSEALHAKTAALGLSGAHVGGISPVFRDTGRGSVAVANVDGGGYQYSLGIAGTTFPELERGLSTWVHVGPRGRVVTTYRFSPTHALAGLGVVSAPPGSALAEVLGGSAATTQTSGYRTVPSVLKAVVRLQR